MVKRLQLHDELEGILGTDKVYFQPPENVKLSYPCIVYKKAPPSTNNADNNTYTYTRCYELTAIYIDPDDDLGERIVKHFSMCKLGKSYTYENLHHDPITLYY